MSGFQSHTASGFQSFQASGFQSRAAAPARYVYAARSTPREGSFFSDAIIEILRQDNGEIEKSLFIEGGIVRIIEVDSNRDLLMVFNNSSGGTSESVFREFYKKDQDGNTLWHWDDADSRIQDVAVDSNRNVFILSEDNLRKFDPAGNLLWKSAMPSVMGGTAASIDIEDACVVGGGSPFGEPGPVMARYDPNGSITWTVSKQDISQAFGGTDARLTVPPSSISCTADGGVTVHMEEGSGSGTQQVYVFSKNGTPLYNPFSIGGLFSSNSIRVTNKSGHFVLASTGQFSRYTREGAFLGNTDIGDLTTVTRRVLASLVDGSPIVMFERTTGDRTFHDVARLSQDLSQQVWASGSQDEFYQAAAADPGRLAVAVNQWKV